jgi:hypothetical protein
MAGYLGTKAVFLSTTAANVTGTITADIGQFNTSLNVDGAVTADGLTVDGDVVLNDQSVVIGSTANSYNEIRFFDSVNTGGTTRIRSSASDLELYTANAERMRIDSSGNVGIGTNSPSAVLETFGGTSFIGAKFKGYTTGKTALVGSDNNSAWFGLDDGTYGLANSISLYGTDNSIRFNTAGSARMRIDSSGNLLVGTTARNGVAVSSLTFNGSAAHGIGIKTTGPTGSAFQVFYNSAGTAVGSISQNGGSGTGYNTSSDYRLKTDAQPMTGASARVQALKPVNFEWIVDGSRVDGFLAHEAQEVVPEAVSGTKGAMRDEEYEVTPASLDDDGNVVTEAVMGTRSVPDYQGIDQSKLVPLLTAALQEALTKIDDMETRLAALEAV